MHKTDQFLLDHTHPVVRDHTVFGHHVLPGLAYIDFLYQHLRAQEPHPLEFELQDLVIYQPLLVGLGDPLLCEVRTTEDAGGARQITVWGRQQHAVRSHPTRYSSAQMRQAGARTFEETIDWACIERSGASVVGLEEIYQECRRRHLVQTGFMKARGSLRTTDTAIYADIQIGEEALADASRVMFHPALMDASAVCAVTALLGNEKIREPGLVLPLFCAGFRASELLQRQCIVRVRRDSMRQKGDIRYVRLEFFTPAGRKVAELDNLGCKIVRDGALPGSIQRPTGNAGSFALPVDEPAELGVEMSASVSGPAPPPVDVESFLRELIGKRLHRPALEVDPHGGYYEMGLNSEALLELVLAIETAFNMRLTPTLLFEYPNVSELASFLTAAHGADIHRSLHHTGGNQQHVQVNATQPGAADQDLRSRPPAAGDNGDSCNDSRRVDSQEIAIIGLAGRFPQAHTIDEFWENLRSGRDCITEIPSARWNRSLLEELQSPSGKRMSRWGGFIDDPDCFDAPFFRLSPRQAEMLDPQERLFLEVSWEAIEDAGYTPKNLAASRGLGRGQRVGVFVGVMHKDYALVGAEALSRGAKFPLSLNYAPIANRVSYFCNFHGPSMAVDTVCSSSLTAVHLALQSIRSGECEAAIAGGVNLSLHPAKYMTYGMAEMHSSDGRCRAFGKGGDGYVSGEAVGAVILKPLHRALEDNDHVYAVIKRSRVNHGGTVSGITVPSPVAQAELISDCIENSGIDPRTISYVEAHGTGTSLGDPIELDGLTKAYRRYTQLSQYCAIGSVKSNIGHAEAAAGVAGLIKLALQFKHATLAPSLHAEELNEYVDWAESPFVVQRRVEEWTRPRFHENGQEVVYPRRAALSSFGATGSNVHIILEEGPEIFPKPAATSPADGLTVVPLSAKTPERLQVYAAKLLQFMEAQSCDLATVAYTLQVGREALQSRVAFVVRDRAELVEKVRAFVKKQEVARGCFQGNLQLGSDAAPMFGVEEESREFIENLLAKGNVERLAGLWAKGRPIDWSLLYGADRPSRISLPTYPFAKERYWVPSPPARDLESSPSAIPVLHPLLHANTSDLEGQRFSSTFTGDEFFLADHLVQGARVLPGVAYLEMARAAVQQAVGQRPSNATSAGEPPIISLRNVAWSQPLVAGGAFVSVHIGLVARGTGEIAYEIYSEPSGVAKVREANNGPADSVVVYAQGTAVFTGAPELARIDLALLRNQCGSKNITGPEIYARLRDLGLAYGEGFRGVEEVSLGRDERDRPFVLGRVRLPSSVASTQAQYGLHPSLLDGALQLGIALAESGLPQGEQTAGAPKGPLLPFALDRLDILRPGPASTWVYLREANNSTARVRKLDLDLCDDGGLVWARLQGLAARVLKGHVAHPAGITWTMIPNWEASALDTNTKVIGPPAFNEHWVLSCMPDNEPALASSPDLQWVQFSMHQSKGTDRFELVAKRLLETLHRIVANKVSGSALVQFVIPMPDDAGLIGLSGMLKVAHLEEPRVTTQLIATSADERAEILLQKLRDNANAGGDTVIRYANNVRQVERLHDVDQPDTLADQSVFIAGGVYLIAGGASGLGLHVARAVAERTADVTLVLAGRSRMGESQREAMEQIEKLGGRVEYQCVDITDRPAVEELIRGVTGRYQRLDGVIHSAGVIRDSFLIKKTEEELAAVLGPKVRGVVNLDEATQHLPLDVFVAFSSLVGVLGNVGQADYAAANGFLDQYMRRRARWVREGRRSGRSLSINWPLWAEGGMRVDAEVTEAHRRLGLTPLATGRGVDAFFEALSLKQPQVLVFSGERRALRATVSREPAPPEADVAALNSGAIDTRRLKERTLHYLKSLMARMLKLPLDRIEARAALEEYGIDSVMVLHLSNELEQSFGLLSKTLFFEYQNLEELAEYLLRSHRGALTALLGEEEPAPRTPRSAASTPPASRAEDVPIAHSRHRYGMPGGRLVAEKDTSLDVAIVGVAGRYPQARNVQQYWENLAGGKDCITEIPAERWDHRLYFDPEEGRAGKTYSKWGGFMEGVEQFDPLFFNISPREAEVMDPQERLFLQCVYETLEDAGYTREALSRYRGLGLEGNVGVFVGVMDQEYPLFGAQAQLVGSPIALSTSRSSIANRISYFFNLHGPSLAVDTMCSSSLTALHLACRSLAHGGCELALAGGVNVSIHPNKYLTLAQAQFASSKGRCESFGAGGDGYVPGEGVGSVLLKPLAKAIADGDHIYAVIKGSAINHGGKTNGYTVPNPAAQRQVIAQALKESGIPARAISYIEAHGTGTALGDPIEITGLSQAFGEQTEERQFCAIGSAKSNIGHAESAAGIAGVTKVLLQMRHGQLVPSLHAETLNPHIDFASTPFVVQRTLAEWTRPRLTIDGQEREFPRTAGVSAFGAGGANAHVVLQEYIQEPARVPGAMVTADRPAMVVLSAKSAEQLQTQVERLLDALESEGWTEAELPRVAYTLQLGREAMEHRLALTANSVAQLRAKLRGVTEGSQALEEVYQGEVKRHKEALAVFSADEELLEAIGKWIERGKYGKLLALWVKGLSFDWRQLYGDSRMEPMRLPTYPFSAERCWVPMRAITGPPVLLPDSAAHAVLHPLLQLNESDFFEQRFSSSFTGTEFFLADHVVRGARMLPGMVYLEMARAAVEQACGLSPVAEAGVPAAQAILLQDIVWSRPLLVTGEAVTIHTTLRQEEPGEIAFEIYLASKHAGEASAGDSQTTLCQGKAALMDLRETPSLDLDVLKLKCDGAGWTREHCYAVFEAAGVEYGPGYRGIEHLWAGTSSQERRFALARVVLPSSVEPRDRRYVLHPAVMDAAVQACLGMALDTSSGSHTGSPASLPFELRELEIFGPSPACGWAYVEAASGSVLTVLKLDITLCDDQGRICVRIKDLSFRAVAETMDETGSFLQTPIFAPEAVQQEPAGEAPQYGQCWVALCGEETDWVSQTLLRRALADLGLEAHYLDAIQPDDGPGIAQQFERCAARLLTVVQEILRGKPKGRVLFQFVVPVEGERAIFSGLSGLLQSAHLENPLFIGQVIGMEHGESAEAIARKLFENAMCVRDCIIRYANNMRQVERLHDVDQPDTLADQSVFIAGGVYLIAGGASGLGLHVAWAVAERTADVTLVLAGRSRMGESQREAMEQIEKLGGRVEYQCVDITDRPAVEELIRGVTGRYQRLDGVIHSAGVIRDSFLIKKTEEELAAVLGPKVRGVVNLDEATQHLPLDVFVAFSSLVGVLGNVGQADYAAANGFLDQYMRRRARWVREGRRSGRSLSINWPLWAEGGMRVDAETRRQMGDRGVRPLSTPAGLDAFFMALASRQPQVLVFSGERRVQRTNVPRQSLNPAISVNENSSGAIDAQRLKDRTLQYLKNVTARMLKLPVNRIETDTPLEQYGLDSVLALRLTAEMEKTVGLLSKTLLFEYQTIDQLAEYLLETHRGALLEMEGVEGPRPLAVQGGLNLGVTSVPAAQERRKLQGRHQPAYRVPSGVPKSAVRDVAIIGMAGRYPQAGDLQQFWKNLKEGKDCITEIPPGRWDHSGHFHPQKGKPGTAYSKWGGFIDGVDQFDPLFFNISPTEAEVIDPQERLFLEIVWGLLEGSGYTRRRLQEVYRGSVGVYVGAMYHQYSSLESDLARESVTALSTYGAIANRVSYFYGLSGPSIAIDTMCSSSTIAIHLACKDLWQGECSLAIAGGVNLSIHPKKYIGLCQAQLLGGNPERRSFAESDGFLPAEAVGAVLLKPLARAVEDGDNILAILKASTSNHGGPSNGYAVPNLNAQIQLMEDSLRKADVDAKTISYVEAAANGSALADAIEVAALTRVFGPRSSGHASCAIGSVKSNIGHAEAASGITQLTKVVLQMQHARLVPTIKAEPLNPSICFDETPFYLLREAAPWERPVVALEEVNREYPRRALINSFGAGGSNAALIVEEYISAAEPAAETLFAEGPEVMTFSAKSVDRLQVVVRQMLEYLQTNEDISLANVAYTLQCGRESMPSRMAVVVNGRQQLINAMQAYLDASAKGRQLDEDGSAPPFYAEELNRHRSMVQELSAGAVGDAIVQLLVAGRDLDKLALLWAHGVEVAWDRLHEGRGRRMLSLPTYPFEPGRCWLPGSKARQISQVGAPVSFASSLETPAHAPNGAAAPEGGDAWGRSGGCEDVAPALETLEVAVSPARVLQRSGHDLPRNDLERTIVEVWQDVLGIRGIGILDNFLDLGGSSVSGAQIISRIRDLYHVDIPVRAFVSAEATIAALALEIVAQLAQMHEAAVLEKHFEAVAHK